MGIGFKAKSHGPTLVGGWEAFIHPLQEIYVTMWRVGGTIRVYRADVPHLTVFFGVG